ncbi:MAG: translation initiation factor IF-2 subunit gamma, partial [Nanopusillaceae archaeon]
VKYQVIRELFEKAPELNRGEEIAVAIYNIVSLGTIKSIEKGNIITVKLSKPILGNKNDRVLILKKIDKRWKIYAIGNLLNE